MRLGIFGGSFDPIHYGHLILAECCREQHALDRVWFVPTAVSPHKIGAEPVSAAARCEMLKLAIGGHVPFDICKIEIERGGVSYTVDTLTAIKDEHPEAELFFLMGADSLADFGSWREPARICELAKVVVVSRPGSGDPDFDSLNGVVDAKVAEEIRSLHVQMPQIEISSSEIRARVAEGRTIRFQTARAVEKYIETNQLYLPA
ncbi:MAG: nicotinate-nucleotide adenylyltransferase [Planctomycetota bacterium]